MSDALAGHDVLAKSPTGSGKTLAFAIPIVERLHVPCPTPAALILVPTRELATQVAGEFLDITKAKRLHVAASYGGVSIREQAASVRRAHVLIATPGRLEDLATRGLVRLDGVRILVLDEADRMLDMGFKPQVGKIVDRLPKERQTMFFSATLEGETGWLARVYTRNARWHEVEARKQTVDEVDHRFIPVTSGTKVAALADVLRSDRDLALVFVRTKRGADRLVRKLHAHGVKALELHGDMTQAARHRALARFEAGDVDTLVATDVAARGLDLDRISHVINFDPPDSAKSYVHRVGRTARAGRSGSGVTLVLPTEQHDVGLIANELKLQTEFQREGLKISKPVTIYSSRRGRSRRWR
jgi:ATP-dependent RNA helicase RhlE